MPDIFDELDTEASTPKKDIFDELEPTPPIRPSTGALGTRFRTSATNPFAIPPTQSVFGISPEEIPSGANTTHPEITIPLSVLGKTAAGVAGYVTSPQGATETALSLTPAAPAIFAKWAFDMARGGYRSVKAIVDEVGGMAREAFNRGIISANQLGPIPEGVSTQEHIQSLAENAANAALMGLGAVGAAAHVKLPTKEVPALPEATEAPKPTPEDVELKQALSELPKEKTAIEIGIESGALTKEGVPTPAFQGLKPGEAALLMDAITDPNTKLPERARARLMARVKREKEEGVLGPEVAPSEEAWVPKPSEAPVSAAVEPSVAPEGTPQAMPQGGTPEPSKQAGSVTGPVTEPGPGTIGEAEMGAAGIREIPETGAGGEKYGVAERVRAERAQAGQVEPVAPGEGTTPQKTIALGREIIRKDPEAGTRIMEQFESDPEKRTSETGIAVVRAHGESLAAGARTIEEHYGTESPEYKAAKEVLSDWDRRSKAMQTQWHRQGQAQQGETDIDTASYTGLERARQQATGNDIPKAQKPRAKKIAKENKQAQNDLRVALDTLNKAIRTRSNPEQAALDAASKTVRENAVRLADAENKSRVAEQAAKQATEQVQKDAAQSALEAAKKTTADAATRRAREENKARVEQAKRDKQVADIHAKAANKALDAAREVERKATLRAAKEAQRRANDPSISVWEKAKEILDENKGVYSFDDLRNKLAAELNMSTSKVASILAQDPTVKRLAADVLIKQRNARRLKEQAKIWLRELDTPGYQRALRTIPNFMFSLSVGGHGLVALGTHAPIVAFQPRFWGAYVRNFGRMYKMVFNPAYYEMQMQDLVRRPNYDVARESGLQNDPFKYEAFHTTMLRDLVKDWIGEKNIDRVDKFLSAGNRGYGVLKLLRQDMFDQSYDRLPRNIRVQEGVAAALSDGINHATGVTQKQGFKGSNILLFAPRLAGSRVMWLGGDPVRAGAAILDWKNATTAEKLFAENQIREKAWVFGTFASLLAMNQGFLAATGSTQKINGIPEALGGAGFDPLAGDFLKFKVHGANIAYGGALLTLCKLPVRVGYAIAYEGKGSKYVLEEERVDKVVLGYLRTQASPFAGTVADLAFGRDFEQRPLPRKLFGAMEQTGAVPKRLVQQGVDEPYSWLEYAGTKLPIPIAEALKEGLKGSGVPGEQLSYWIKAFGIATIMTGTGTRITEDTREE